MAVGIHQAWHDPGIAADGDGIGNRFSADQAINHPQVGRFALRQQHPGEMQPPARDGVVTNHRRMAVSEELRCPQSGGQVMVSHARSG